MHLINRLKVNITVHLFLLFLLIELDINNKLMGSTRSQYTFNTAIIQ